MLDGFVQPPLVFGTHARNRCFRHPQSLCLRDCLVAGLAQSSPKTLAPAATSMTCWRVGIEHAELGRCDRTHVKEVNACITCMPGCQLTAQSWLRCVRTPADGGPVQKGSAHAARERGLAVRATALDRSAAAWDLQGICFERRCVVRYLQRGVRTLHEYWYPRLPPRLLRFLGGPVRGVFTRRKEELMFLTKRESPAREKKCTCAAKF